MKVMTFNVRMDSPDDPLPWANKKEFVEQIIETYHPDIIGFQEVMRHMETDLATMLSNYTYYGEYRSLDADAEMAPVFLRKGDLEMADRGSFMLSDTPEIMYSKSWDSSMERVASWVVINDTTTQHPKYIALNVHLDHQGDEARIQSSIMLEQTIREMVEKVAVPVIMTGDFNAEPDSQLIDALLNSDFIVNSFQALQNEDALTFHGYTNKTQGLPIDYIFLTHHLTIKDVSIIRDQFDGYYPSDHYPILVEF